MDKQTVMTAEEVAELLRVAVGTVREKARQGKLPARKVGKEWRFRRDEIMAWLSGNGGDRQ